MIAKDQVSAGHFKLCEEWYTVTASQVHMYKPLLFIHLYPTLHIYP